jgi:threonine/homoserine/homoserine lactone efflux protein
MFGVQHLGLFLVSAVMLNIAPGPDTFYILGRSIAQGRRAGLLSVLGIVSGCAIHSVAAAIGLSAVLATSATAFLFAKLVGATYLVYLGARMLLDSSQYSPDLAETPAATNWAIYRAGLLTNLLNPKVALFFLSFLPQFVDPGADSRIMAFLLLGGLFICTGTTWCVFLALSASSISGRLRTHRRVGAWINRATGALFVGLEIKLAASD